MLWHGKNFRGFLNKASQVLFNKTGTTLNSTNVQDAICEINSNLSGKLAYSVTPTSGNNAQALNDLFNHIDMSKVSHKSFLVNTFNGEDIHYRISGLKSNYIQLDRCWAAGNGIGCETFLLSSNSSWCQGYYINSFTYTDLSQSAVNVGRTFSFYY